MSGLAIPTGPVSPTHIIAALVFAALFLAAVKGWRDGGET